MLKIGDLVKRTKVLSVEENDYRWIEYEFPTEDMGIVIDIESPIVESQALGLEPMSFIKVLWQNIDLGSCWHLIDELILIKTSK